MNGTKNDKNSPDKEKISSQELPLYDPKDDIYVKSEQDEDIDPEDVTSTKKTNETNKEGGANEKNFSDDISGDDLDIPGAELDDDQENIGSEDEENNHYSIGGDNHNDLEEDKG